MAQSGTYIGELQNEQKITDPDSHANRLLTQEISRLVKGETEDEGKGEKKERPFNPLIELHSDRPQKCSLRIRIPIKEHPKYNFVGKLLGPKGTTLKALQDQTGCKMAIMGKGSMREKEKEEECRKAGGKYAHLNEDLHVFVECYADVIEGHHRIAAAMVELKKFLIPEESEEMYGDEGRMGMNGAPRGRGGFRGAPERGRGSFRGRGNGHAPPPPSARGSPAARGAPSRGGPRGGPAPRGAPAPRGRPAASQYDAYSQSYTGGAGAGYGAYDSYEDSYAQDSSYYDYGQTGYDSYSSGGYGDYSDSWGASGGGKTSSAPSRGASRGGARSHPYSRPAQGSY